MVNDDDYKVARFDRDKVKNEPTMDHFSCSSNDYRYQCLTSLDVNTSPFLHSLYYSLSTFLLLSASSS